ncbi:RNA polymerase sigma factor [Streptosporangium roseum]|uniref:RNA polymerase sigma factor n=1 Tax=Streptosporangium roseum TaxID=2001 RepID=UPI000A4A1811|nr:RNA polymerase sigma factor [Streptosporangium roseum]
MTDIRHERFSMTTTPVERPPDQSLDDFSAVFDTYFSEIHRYVTQRLGPGPAEDVVAEAFLTAFRKRARYDPAKAGVRTWLYGIVTNLIHKHRRTEVRTLRAVDRHGPPADAPSHEERVAAQVSAESLRPALAEAIARLGRGERDVLLLSALAGLSHEEIAAALGISYGTVGSRLSRARAKIRVAMGGANPMETNHG